MLPSAKQFPELHQLQQLMDQYPSQADYQLLNHIHVKNFNLPIWAISLGSNNPNHPVIGFFGGAVQVFYWEVLEAVRPQGTAVSALGWIWTVDGSLMALGAALGGIIASEFSPRFTLLSTTIAVLIGLIVLYSGRRLLAPSDRVTKEYVDFQTT